jgi:trans-aconitate 2-methyltransferase
LSEYTFGDTDLARERLAIVADAFAPPTRALLSELPAERPRYVVDLGCGPGYTTALLAERFSESYVTGLDSSAAMIDEARTRVGHALFAVADVSERLQLPADLAYARLLLGHLPAPGRALEAWARSLRGQGLLVCEEPVRYRYHDEWFARYEAAVTGVVALTGATLWAAADLEATPLACTRIVDRVVEHPVSVRTAAAMFWRNAVQWRDRVADADALIDHFRALDRGVAPEAACKASPEGGESDSGEDTSTDDVVMWEIRQVVYVKNRV